MLEDNFFIAANLRQVLVLDLHLLPLVMHRPFPAHMGEEEEEESEEKIKGEHPTRDQLVCNTIQGERRPERAKLPKLVKEKPQ